MFFVNGTRIYLTRGDSARLRVDINNTATGAKYELQDGDKLELSIKRRAIDKQTVVPVKLADKDGVFTFLPDDTSGLQFATYKYDVQLTTADGDVSTVIKPDDFEIGEEVTWGE